MNGNRSKAHFSPAVFGSPTPMLAGQIAKAQALFDRVVAVANDLGLLAAEFIPAKGAKPGTSRKP